MSRNLDRRGRLTAGKRRDYEQIRKDLIARAVLVAEGADVAFTLENLMEDLVIQVLLTEANEAEAAAAAATKE